MKFAIFGTGGVGGYFGVSHKQACWYAWGALDVSTPTHEFIYASLLPMELKAHGK